MEIGAESPVRRLLLLVALMSAVQSGTTSVIDNTTELLTDLTNSTPDPTEAQEMTTLIADVTTVVEDATTVVADACNIKQCPADMSCYLDENECPLSNCSVNTRYCKNGGKCVEPVAPSAFISCNCDEKYTGLRCEDMKAEDSIGKPDLYVGIIAASAIAGGVVLAILLASCINFCNKRRIRTGKPDELFGIENVVALELTDERSYVIEGTATQTDESFLLARSHKDGVPPKPGHTHKIMQTNDSFLLAKAELLRAHGLASRHTGAGSPVGVVSANTRQFSAPSDCKSGVVGSGGATPMSSSSGANGVSRKASAKKDRAPEPPLGHSPGPGTLPERASKDLNPADDGGIQEKETPFAAQENGSKATNGAADDGQISREPRADAKNAELEVSPGRRILKV